MVVHEVVAIGLLVIMLSISLVRVPGWVEGGLAIACASLAVALGTVDRSVGWHSIRAIDGVVAFLMGVLVLGEACRALGFFGALGDRLASVRARSGNDLLRSTVAIAAATSALLSLDATVVLLTPSVSRAATTRDLPPRPHEYACVRVANSGSLLLPVSNLTNLLVFGALGISFLRFTVLMAPVWLVAVTLELMALRRRFRRDLKPRAGTPDVSPTSLPPLPLVVFAVALVGFVVASLAGIALAWVVWAAASVLAIAALRQRTLGVGRLVRSAHVGFALYVFGLAVVVEAVVENGAGRWLAHVMPTGTGLVDLLAIAVVAMIAANLLNNLPATLLLLTVVPAAPPALLALLVGVNVGASATYVGSLANLLWVRTLRRMGRRPSALTFHRLGLTRTPVIVVASTIVLWAWLGVVGWS